MELIMLVNGLVISKLNKKQSMPNINTKIQNKIMQDEMMYGTGIYIQSDVRLSHIPFQDTLMKSPKRMMKQVSRKELQKLAIKYKESKMPRDNNCKENHERGLQKRKEMFGIQETVSSLQTRKRLTELNQFYGKVLKMLKLA